MTFYYPGGAEVLVPNQPGSVPHLLSTFAFRSDSISCCVSTSAQQGIVVVVVCMQNGWPGRTYIVCEAKNMKCSIASHREGGNCRVCPKRVLEWLLYFYCHNEESHFARLESRPSWINTSIHSIPGLFFILSISCIIRCNCVSLPAMCLLNLYLHFPSSFAWDHVEIHISVQVQDDARRRRRIIFYDLFVLPLLCPPTIRIRRSLILW